VKNNKCTTNPNFQGFIQMEGILAKYRKLEPNPPWALFAHIGDNININFYSSYSDYTNF